MTNVRTQITRYVTLTELDKRKLLEPLGEMRAIRRRLREWASPGGEGETMLEVMKAEQQTYREAALGKFRDKIEDLGNVIDLLERGILTREDVLDYLRIPIRRRLRPEEGIAAREEVHVDTLQEDLHDIASWALRSTITQFANQVAVKIRDQDHGYQTEREGNTLTFYKIIKTGGFLGFGESESREPVLRVTIDGEDVTFAEDPRDTEFVSMVARVLRSPHIGATELF